MVAGVFFLSFDHLANPVLALNYDVAVSGGESNHSCQDKNDGYEKTY